MILFVVAITGRPPVAIVCLLLLFAVLLVAIVCLLLLAIFRIVSARLLSLFANDIVCCCNSRKASSCNCLLAVTICSIVSAR